MITAKEARDLATCPPRLKKAEEAEMWEIMYNIEKHILAASHKKDRRAYYPIAFLSKPLFLNLSYELTKLGYTLKPCPTKEIEISW
jgi:hypothetical protein